MYNQPIIVICNAYDIYMYIYIYIYIHICNTMICNNADLAIVLGANAQLSKDAS